MDSEIVFDNQEVRKILPHRYPFLMVDRVVEFVTNERIVALKNVSANEPYFAGHFPQRPVMPGVMILEAMAQTGAILAMRSPEGSDPDKILYLAGADRVKFKRPVYPGDCLRIEMSSPVRKGRIWRMEGEVSVEGSMVARGVCIAAEGEAL